MKVIRIHYKGSNGEKYNFECGIGSRPFISDEDEAIGVGMKFLYKVLVIERNRKFWWFQKKPIPTLTFSHIEDVQPV